MNSPRIKASLMALIFLILTITTSAHADEDFGHFADFETVKRAAEQGIVEAQNRLGHNYSIGNGVPIDKVKAVVWYRKAAHQGLAKAQFNLAKMYRYGNGVPTNYVQAYCWGSLAQAQGHERARFELMDDLAEQMTKEQIAEAQKIATKWYEAHQK
jgi:TPR repeat protein